LVFSPRHAILKVADMIKNIKQYLKESERKRKKYLQTLTYAKSASAMEQLIGSRFMLELNFSQDDHPVALHKLIKHQR